LLFDGGPNLFPAYADILCDSTTGCEGQIMSHTRKIAIAIGTFVLIGAVFAG